MSQREDIEQFENLLRYVRQNRGLDFTGYKRPSLMRLVSKRTQMLSLDHFGDYLDYLEVHPEEFSQLFNTILINVTSFFATRKPGNTSPIRLSPKFFGKNIRASRSEYGERAGRPGKKPTPSPWYWLRPWELRHFARESKIYANQHLNILVWNHRAEDLWGLREDEVKGHSLLNLDIGLPVDRLRAVVRPCLAGENDHTDVLFDAINRRGKTIKCRITCAALVGKQRAARRYPINGGRGKIIHQGRTP